MTPAVTLEWTADGALALERMIIEHGTAKAPSVPGEPIARIVPLIDGGLPVTEPVDVMADFIQQDLGDDAAARLCVVTPSGEDSHAAVMALASQGPFVLTASPRTIDGAEHVMHLLRKLLWEPALARYPHAVGIDLPVGEILLPQCRGWLRRRSADRESLLVASVAVHAGVPMHAAALSRLVSEAVKEAHPGLGERERARRADQVMQKLLQARAWHGWWALCPLCGGDPEHEDRTEFDEDFFRYHCATVSCRCRWRVLECDCGRRTGIIDPRDAAAGGRSYLAVNGDLLSRPVIRADGHEWLCDRCFVSAVESVGAAPSSLEPGPG